MLSIAFFVLTGKNNAAGIIEINRICRDGNNNSISFKKNNIFCVLKSMVALYGRENPTSSFFFIDSLIGSETNFLHLNANVPFNKLWSYFLLAKIECGGVYTDYISDTIQVDIVPPFLTKIDSVSVIPETNKVVIGWSKNNTPDFSHFSIFNYNRTDPRVEEVFREENYIDSLSGNVNTTQLLYEITTVDSCGNRAAFGNASHGTIVLSGIADTCRNKIILNWIGYKGWSKIKSYTVYKSINNQTYIPIFTSDENISQYIDNDVTQQKNYKYFVRATKDTNVLITSSSNSISLNIGNREALKPISINYITVDDNKIRIEIDVNKISDYNFIYLLKENEIGEYKKHNEFTISNTILLNDDIGKINRYRVVWGNICGIEEDTSKMSNNIVLKVLDVNNISLQWNEYFTWNNGVKEYKIYKRLYNDSNFNLIGITSNTIYNDIISEGGCCYYVEAIENIGNGKSKSNVNCYFIKNEIYYPNAITSGLNNKFTFIGVGIDLNNTSLRIYNRYGQLVFYTESLITGWYGTNQNGEMLQNDVYFFDATISLPKNEKVNKRGTITIIR